MFSVNTSLGLGHPLSVENLTFMYDVRKQEKMKVSESRKIHIIALPHGTENACLSEAKSPATCWSGLRAAAWASWAIGGPSSHRNSSTANTASQTSSRKCQ